MHPKARSYMNFLSIQSHVAYGHVGNSAAVFPLQRLGHEVWPVHTVQFSNHTGYGAWRGPVFDGNTIREVVRGIAERGVLGTCDGVLSGYMGSADIGDAILDAVAQVKQANPKAQYCCDPVIGDVGRGVFVRPGIPEFMRERAVPAADVVTPNHFELDQLTERTTRTITDVLAAIDTVHARGPRVVFVTSLQTQDTPEDAIDVVASDASGRFRVRTTRLPVSLNGAGDTIAALFFAHLMQGASAFEAVSSAVSSVFGVIRRTAEAGAREMLLVAAQDELVTPRELYVAQRLAG
jgi:pyridoxine kinase